MKGVPFSNKRYTKGVPFLTKMVHKRVRGWTSYKTFLSTLPPPPPGIQAGLHDDTTTDAKQHITLI